MSRRTNTKRLAERYFVVSVVWLILTIIWRVVDAWQLLNQFVQDAPLVIQWATWPMLPAVVGASALLVYIAAQFVPEPETPRLPMDGKFFHTFHPNGQLRYQGQVLREEDGRMFVQIFEPMFGEPTVQRYLAVEERETARFYDSREEWDAEFHRLSAMPAWPDARRE
jgi:hypothetical protein